MPDFVDLDILRNTDDNICIRFLRQEAHYSLRFIFITEKSLHRLNIQALQGFLFIFMITRSLPPFIKLLHINRFVR